MAATDPRAPDHPPAGLFRCPVCARGLQVGVRTWRCPAGHSFDVARQGYVNLAAGRRRHAGDSAAMLDARAAVLASGHLDAVTDAVIAACDGLPRGALVEVGAGTAHHLARVVRALDRHVAVAVDASVPAAKRAARADPERITAVVADAWEPWPLLDGVAAAVLTVFAPRNAAEARRVLAPSGRWIAVVPRPEHLAELVEPLGLLAVDPGKAAQARSEAEAHGLTADVRTVRAVQVLDREAAGSVASMGPSAHHVAPEQLGARLARLPDRLPVTFAVDVVRAQLPV